MKAIRWFFMWRIRSLSGSEPGSVTKAVDDLQEKKGEIIDELGQILTQRPADEVKIQVGIL